MKTYVVIGNSAAGLTAVNTLRRLNQEAKIICISQEKGRPYNKCKLAGFLAGDIQESDVQTFFKNILEDEKIDLLLGKRVIKIASDNNYILLEGGEKISYDKLLITTGASAIRPDINGANLDGVFTFHTLQDAHNILHFIAKNKPKKAVIIGSGMTGLECADALYTRGLDVSVVERNEHVLFRQSDLAGSTLIEQRMKQLGVDVYLQERAKSFRGQGGRVKKVLLESGKELEADVVICAVGVRPNVRLAQEAGLCTTTCGIVVNEYMQTSVQDIYAAGDAVCVKDFISGNTVRSCTWPDACMQAMVAAKSMVFSQEVSSDTSILQPQLYKGAFSLASSEFFGIKFSSCGDISNSGAVYPPAPRLLRTSTIHTKKRENSYNKILLEDNQVKGFLLVGDTSKLGILNRYFMSGQKIDLEQVYSE